MTPSLAVGTIGWNSDGGSAYSLGDTPNDGMTLVNVTLFDGKDPTVPLKKGVGCGRQVLAQIPIDKVALTPYGGRVIVGFPSPNGDTPGHAVVLATLGSSAWKVSGNTGPGDTVIPCASGPARIIMTGKGSIIFATAASDGTTIMVSIDPSRGILAAGPFGTVTFDNMGLRGNIGGGPSFRFYNVQGLPSPFNILMGSVAQISAGTVKVDGLQVLLGPDSVSTTFVPTAAYNDTVNPPAPTPMLAALLAALPAYFATINAVIGKLAASSPTTGVTGADIAAIQAAQAPLTAAINLTGTILTTTCVKVASPV